MVETRASSYPLMEAHPSEAVPAMQPSSLREILETVNQIENKVDRLHVEVATICQSTINKVGSSHGRTDHHRNSKQKGIAEKENDRITGIMDEEVGWKYFQRDFRRSLRKIELSRFGGEDPRGWFAKADRYFHLFRTPEDGKVDLAVLHFEGDANDWLE